MSELFIKRVYLYDSEESSYYSWYIYILSKDISGGINKDKLPF